MFRKNKNKQNNVAKSWVFSWHSPSPVFLFLNFPRFFPKKKSQISKKKKKGDYLLNLDFESKKNNHFLFMILIWYYDSFIFKIDSLTKIKGVLLNGNESKLKLKLKNFQWWWLFFSFDFLAWFFWRARKREKEKENQ